jgi:hypothetical protein
MDLYFEKYVMILAGPRTLHKGSLRDICVQWRTQEFCSEGGSTLFVGGSTNSVEDRGQRERGSGGGSPLFRGSAQFANE